MSGLFISFAALIALVFFSIWVSADEESIYYDESWDGKFWLFVK